MATPKILYGAARSVQSTANINSTGPVVSKLMLPGASEWMIACINTSSLAFKVQGSFDGSTNWHDLSDTITPSAGDVYRGAATGFPFLRILPTAGSGAVDFALALEASGRDSIGAGLSPSTPGAIVDDDVDGTDETLIIDDTGAGCKAVIVCNHGGMYDLLIIDVASGASAPTISATTGAVYRIPPGTWATLDIGPNRDVYARSASGDATVLSLSAQVRS